MQRVAPYAAAPEPPSWRKAAACFAAALAGVVLCGHVAMYHAGSRPDALLQTGEKTPYEHALEAKLATADMNAMRTQQLIKMDPGFWNDMHKMTSDYFASQAGGSDCGVPGGATDKRAAGCIIPVSGDTSGLKCCTSCCQGLMGECGPCENLLPAVVHTDSKGASLGKAPAPPPTPLAKGESTNCGVPGTASDIRRRGCVIPADGSTADLTCCESCCQGLMGECGDCAGLGTAVKHTVVG
jgi:hypothetical protein